MAKGDISKKKIAQALQQAFGDNFKGEYNKAYYVNLSEEGSTVQVKISLVCPKQIVEFDDTPNTTPTGDFDWSDSPAAPKPIAQAAPAEISQEEIDTVKAMLEKLNL